MSDALPAPVPPARGATAATALLLAVTGAAALAHEAAWQRLWTPVAGAGVAGASAVVAGTLLGLAAGAALGGRRSDRARRPGLVFAAAEAVAALLALLVPAAAALAADLLAPGGAALPVVVTLACAVPSFAMGASLPAALRATAPRSGRVGRRLGALYAANTAGAVLGVLATTGFLFESLGVRGVVRAAACAQLVAAGASALLWRRTAGFEPPPPAGRAPGRVGPRPSLSAAAFLAGAAGLAVEIAWVRRLTPALGTTAYAFGTVLGAYLAAIALGAALLSPRRERPAGMRPALVLLAAAVPAACLAPAVAPVADWAGERFARAIEAGEASAATLLWIRAAAAAAIVVPAALLGSAALPWLVHAADPSAAASGRGSGRLLAANALGSALGAVVVGFAAVPAMGTAGVLRAAGACYVAAGALAAPRRGARIALAGATAVAVAVAVVPWPDAAAFEAVGATFAPSLGNPAGDPMTFGAEGRVSTVVVRDVDGEPELWVDGKVVASAQPPDRFHLSLLGHLPMLLHRAPRRVAVIGLGTGITATTCAAYAPERLDVFELEPLVASAAERFRAFGGGLPRAARFHVGDGRTLLLASEGGYDVVTSDPIHPAAAGSTGLYALEHYQAIASRLAPGGVLCQWLPLYEMTVEDVRTALRTLSRVFRVAVFVAGTDLVLVGSREGFAVDPDAMEARMTGEVGESLERLGLRGAGRLLGLLAADPERTLRFAGEGEVSTDDRPVLEFASARSQYLGVSSWNLRLVEVASTRAEDLLAHPARDPAAFADGVRRTARLRTALAQGAEGGEGKTRSARDHFEALAREDERDGFSAAMAATLGVRLADGYVPGDLEEAVDAATRAAAAGRPEAGFPIPRQRLRAAEVLATAGRPGLAAAIAREVLKEVPTSARAARLARAATDSGVR